MCVCVIIVVSDWVCHFLTFVRKLFPSQTGLTVVCGYTFGRNSLPKTHKPVFDSCIGAFRNAGDWRVRPYASARHRVKSKCHERFFNFYNEFLCFKTHHYIYAMFLSLINYPWAWETYSRFLSSASLFLGALIDKFFGGSLGGRGWPTGTIKVAELCAEFSFLGLEAITRCCKYRGYLSNAWILNDMHKELCEGGILCSVNLGLFCIKFVHAGVMLKCRARKAPHGIQDGALGCSSCMYFERCCEACKCCTVWKIVQVSLFLMKEVVLPCLQWSAQLIETFAQFMETFVAVLPSHVYAAHASLAEHPLPTTKDPCPLRSPPPLKRTAIFVLVNEWCPD